MHTKKVLIIVTGGTIDKIHDPKTEALIFEKDGSTKIPDILSLGRCFFPHIHKILLKDSLDFDDDRNSLVEAMLVECIT